jgi:choline dehydrogenase-like flavoprotein
MLQVGPGNRKIIGPIADVMARGCDALGWHHFAVRRNAPDCDGSGFCDFGCRTDARRGTNLSYVPAALEKGAVLLTGLKVERILMDGGRAVGVEGITKTGRHIRVRSQFVVLAGGTIPTPLLLMSQGLCGQSGELGRNLSIHPSGGFFADFDDKISGQNHMPQGYGCDQFQREGLMILSALPDYNVGGIVFPFAGRRLMRVLDRFDNLGGYGLLWRDTKANGRVWRDVGGLPAITYNVQREDVEGMHLAMIRAGELSLAAGARRLIPSVLQGEVLEGKKGLDAFRKRQLTASDVLWTSYHPLGTCKMGDDPKTSVVDMDHQAHDVPGLYIADGSIVPGPLGVNPQITIMAMATRAAERIAAREGVRSQALSA